jgi:hypothetical protein
MEKQAFIITGRTPKKDAFYGEIGRQPSNYYDAFSNLIIEMSRFGYTCYSDIREEDGLAMRQLHFSNKDIPAPVIFGSVEAFIESARQLQQNHIPYFIYNRFELEDEWKESALPFKNAFVEYGVDVLGADEKLIDVRGLLTSLEEECKYNAKKSAIIMLDSTYESQAAIISIIYHIDRIKQMFTDGLFIYNADYFIQDRNKHWACSPFFIERLLSATPIQSFIKDFSKHGAVFHTASNPYQNFLIGNAISNGCVPIFCNQNSEIYNKYTLESKLESFVSEPDTMIKDIGKNVGYFWRDIAEHIVSDVAMLSMSSNSRILRQ